MAIAAFNHKRCSECGHTHACSLVAPDEWMCAWCMSSKYDMDPFGNYQTQFKGKTITVPLRTDEERFRDFMAKFGIDFDRPEPSSAGSCYELHDTVYFDDNGKWQKTTERDGNYDG